MIALTEGLTETVVTDTLPMKGAVYAVVLGTVIYTSFVSGWLAGLGSALLASVYAYYDYLTFGDGLASAADRILLATSVTVTTVGIAVLVGTMRRRSERLADRVLEAERSHVREIQSRNAEVENANAALVEANAALAKSNATLEAFTHVVGHDLKEPVRALEAFSAELDAEHRAALTPAGRALVERIHDASQRLRKLVDGLLEYSRAARIAPGDLEAIRVEDVVRASDCTTRFEAALRERRADLRVDAGPAVRASATGLSQALGNLILNAIKHNPRTDPVVRVRSGVCAPDPRLVEIVVEDNGLGFPAHILASFQGDAGRRPATLRGGFGLLIAREAVEKMGGQLRLGRASGGGAAACITLPAAREAPGPWARAS
jgi:signal transduction histidine kinase